MVRRARALLERLGGIFRRARREREFAAELEAHVAMHIEDNLRAGMTAEEARRQALVKLGGLEQAKELHRERRGVPFLEMLWRDLRYGGRMLRKNPGFTTVAVLTLALGIGANTAIFSIVDAALLRALPYPQANRLVWISAVNPKFPMLGAISAAGFDEIRRSADALETVGAFQETKKAMRVGSGSIWSPVVRMGKGVVRTLGVQPVLGRSFLAEEYQAGRTREVLLSYRLWQEHFGGRRDVLGRSVELDLEPYTVVGVMPAGFEFPDPSIQAWVPLALPAAAAGSNHYKYNFAYEVVGRLKAGVVPRQAQAELDALTPRVPVFVGALALRAEPLQRHYAGKYERPLLILLGAVGLLLLVACANVAGLLLARLSARGRETALRRALGATRRRVLRQLLTESALLGVLGGGAGVLMATVGVGALSSVLPAELQQTGGVGVNLPVLLFTLAVSLTAAVLFGLAPGTFALRTDLNEALKSGGTGDGGTGTVGPRRLQTWLVAGEVALATILVAGGLLLFRSLLRLENVNPGFETRHVVMFSAGLPAAKYKTKLEKQEFYDRVLERLNALPGVSSASFAAPLPFTGWGHAVFAIKGRHFPKGQQPSADFFQVGADYFHTMRIPLLRGRWFRASDSATAAPVAVIDEEMARAYWPNENPISKKIELTRDWRIVGIVGHTRFLDLAKDPGPEFYVPLAQVDPWMGGIVMRTAVPPKSLLATIRGVVRGIDPDVPLFDQMTLDERIAGTMSDRRLQALLLGLFGGLAVLLTAVGIGGTVSCTVSQRRREMGLRMALGAQPEQLLRLTMGENLWMVGLGLVAGLAGALALSRFLTSLLFGVGRWDAVSFAGTAAVVVVVALVASWVPARRAMRVDPMAVLRQE
jgi:predicted permease